MCCGGRHGRRNVVACFHLNDKHKTLLPERDRDGKREYQCELCVHYRSDNTSEENTENNLCNKFDESRGEYWCREIDNEAIERKKERGEDVKRYCLRQCNCQKCKGWQCCNCQHRNAAIHQTDVCRSCKHERVRLRDRTQCCTNNVSMWLYCPAQARGCYGLCDEAATRGWEPAAFLWTPGMSHTLLRTGVTEYNCSIPVLPHQVQYRD